MSPITDNRSSARKLWQQALVQPFTQQSALHQLPQLRHTQDSRLLRLTPANSVKSLEVVDVDSTPGTPAHSIKSLEDSDAAPTNMTSGSSLVVPGNSTQLVGPPGLTVGATQRWYVVTVGTHVGVFQG